MLEKLSQLCELCGKILDLGLPLTWSDLGSIATALAVIVALFANHNSNKQLQKTLQMHEQTKNIDLLDKRIEFIDAIKSDHSISDLKFQILFDENIIELKKEWDTIKQEIAEYKYYLGEYVSCLEETSSDRGPDSPMNQIQDAERDCSEAEPIFDQPESDEYKSRYQKFQKICEKYALIIRVHGAENEWRLCNYQELTKSINNAEKKAGQAKQKLQDAMILFVQESIKPLDKTMPCHSFKLLNKTMICNFFEKIGLKFKQKENHHEV